MVMRNAIQYNLAGSIKNDPKMTVEFTLQGDPERIGSAIKAIGIGTPKSSNVEVKTSPAAVTPDLDTFTIIDWTSTRRQILTPYTLVFHLRGKDDVISESDAHHEWHTILKDTLKGDDLDKLHGGE